MDDKKYRVFIFIVLVLFLMWWLLHRRNVRMQSSNNQTNNAGHVGTINDPELLTYSADPNAFGPRTINGSVNIEVNGYNGLNQNLMPLFGFVGMAQGELYQ